MTQRSTSKKSPETTPRPDTRLDTRRRNALERQLDNSLRELDALLDQPAQLREVDRDYREALDLIERRLRGH